MKYILKLILTLALFTTTIYAEKINECKTDIYFGNGVWNSIEDAKYNAIKLQNKIIKEDPKLQAKYGKVKLQYNWSHGRMIDILETFYQLKEAGQISEEWFFTFVDELMAKQLSDITDEDVKSLREQIINMIISVEEDEVDKMLVKYYDESFKYSHRVLLVSHSQGNLFANRVHDKINPTEYKNYFANLQVASPASEVKAQKGDYVTGFVDPIINPIPGSMTSNADIDFPGGHKFVEAYLASEDTLTNITDKIKQLLVSLDAEPSQWETDQELNKGTKDYKITLKHIFDSSVFMSEEVYPFASSKKLYQVTDNTGGNGWIKASCGGSEVFDDWTDKKENEFYLINNIEEEKIVAKITEKVQYLLPLYNPNKSLEEHNFIIDDNAKKVLISLDSYDPCGYMDNSGFVSYQIYVIVNNQNVLTMDFSNIVEEDFLNVDITNNINYGNNTIEASCYSYDNPFAEYNYVSVEIKSFF
jgi:hypothetical protein